MLLISTWASAQSNEKLERMTQNTQRVMFVDSMVIDKQNFLDAYRLTKEVGQISSYEKYFHSALQPEAYVYVNELASHCYLAMSPTDSTMMLYASENNEQHWTTPKPLRGINDDNEFRRINFPFMMGDGQTFYFAAEGNDGLGGYDIYVTRYKSDDDVFLHPANIGMPFNSEANDYMYVIDEYANLGWFATDRNQPEGKVCVYTFIPPTTRETYVTDSLSEETLSRLAHIASIADTWYDDAALTAARSRLNDISATTSISGGATVGSISFTINDGLTYTKVSDCRAPGNQDRLRELQKLKRQYQRLVTTLNRARDYYATASLNERAELKSEILASEQKQHELYVSIHTLEKKIRNTENLFLTKNR